MRTGKRTKLQTGVAQPVPIGLRRDDFATKQPNDHAERLIEPVADRVMIDAEHVGIVGQGTGASAEHEAAHQLMI